MNSNKKETKEIFFIAPVGEKESDERKCSDFVLWMLQQYLKKYLEGKESDEVYNIARHDTGDNKSASLITNGIIENIMACDSIIAFLEFNKPNVFYEIGLAQL